MSYISEYRAYEMRFMMYKFIIWMSVRKVEFECHFYGCKNSKYRIKTGFYTKRWLQFLPAWNQIPSTYFYNGWTWKFFWRKPIQTRGYTYTFLVTPEAYRPQEVQGDYISLRRYYLVIFLTDCPSILMSFLRQHYYENFLLMNLRYIIKAGNWMLTKAELDQTRKLGTTYGTIEATLVRP